jgi:hypothetical protein
MCHTYKSMLFLLPLLLIACNDRGSSPTPSSHAAAPAAPVGMNKFPYLAADGGPHMLLPVDVASAWTGVTSMAAALDPSSDYGRACTVALSKEMSLLSVGSSNAVIFADPPMSSWGKSADGLVEIYYLKSWTTMDTDSLIDRATASLPTASLTDSGHKLKLTAPDAFLLFAGDTTSGSAYGVHRVTLPAAEYRILVGTYASAGESVTVYRLQPVLP